MIVYDKALKSPAFRRRSVRREISLFKEREGALLARGLHFKAEDGALVPAEGAEKLCDAADVRALSAAEGQAPKLFVLGEGGALRAIGEEQTYSHPGAQAILSMTEGDAPGYFVLTREGLCRLGEAAIEGAPGGRCGAVYSERIFVADGSRLRWSKPLAPTDWTETVQGAGELHLPSECGEILALLPFRGKLCLFRERGIELLRAEGDTLAFRLERVPYACGGIIGGSVRAVGSRAVFLTGSGLFSFDGSGCERLGGCGFSELDLKEPVGSASWDGMYYAAVTAGGKRRLWCVDPVRKEGHFLRAPAEDVAACGGLVFLAEGKLWRLNWRGLPRFGRRECVLVTEPSLLGLSPRGKFLDGVTVEGRGNFRVEARGSGIPRACSGRAGERLAFPCPVRGTSFSFELRTLSEDACVRGITLDLREETGTW